MNSRADAVFRSRGPWSRVARLAWVAIVAASLSVRPCIARAEGSAPAASETKREASAHFRRGVQLYQESAYRAALIELERAYEIAPDYRVLFNIGQARYALGEYVEAGHAFESYLGQGGAKLTAARREEVANMVLELKQRVASLIIEVDQDGASVFVDGNKVGTSPMRDAVPLSVGRHILHAETEDGASVSRSVDVAGGDRTTVELTLVPTEVVAEPLPPPPPTPAGLSTRKRWGWGLLSGGVAAGISGAVMAALAKKADGDYIDALRARPGNTARITSAHDDLQRNAIVADVLFGTAVAAAATGLVLVLLKEPRADAKPAALQVGVGYQSIVATGRF